MAADPQTTRDEERIRVNMRRYLEASGEHGQLVWRAQNAKAEMDRALRDLQAAGGHAEAERLTNG